VEENRLISLVPVPSTMPDNSVCSRKQGMRSAKEYMDMVCNIYSRTVRVTHLLICHRQTLYYKNDLYIC